MLTQTPCPLAVRACWQSGRRPPGCRQVLVQAVANQSRGELPKELIVPPLNGSCDQR